MKRVLVLLTIKYFMERWILQTSNGKSLRPSYHQIAFGPIGAVVPGVIGEPYSMGFFGFCGPARAGRICPRNTARTRPCIGDSRIGYVPRCSNRCCWRWPRTSRTEAASTCGSASSTEPLFRRKKGALRGKN